MALTVLQVAYPLAPVSRDAAGGAEQIVASLDRAVTKAGHTSIVLACQGSTAAGILQAMNVSERETLTEEARHHAQRELRHAIVNTLRRWSIDVIHMHGVDFYTYLPEPGVPVLVTLHLPPAWYPREVFFLNRPQTYLQCVSHAQEQECPQDAALLPFIENGVPADLLTCNFSRRNFALVIGRICPEKGFHLALDAAERAGMPLLIAGKVFRYEAHEQYFSEVIAPRLGPAAHFLGPIDFGRKRTLLNAANCLLVPSIVSETSSLVAMEALACGTPVIAFRSGALREIIEEGKTGFLVHDAHEMAEAMNELHRIDRETCRQTARERFSVERMTSEYLQRYEILAQGSRAERTTGACA